MRFRVSDVGGCQNYGPFLGTLNIRCRILTGTQKRDQNFDNHKCRVQGFVFQLRIYRLELKV